MKLGIDISQIAYNGTGVSRFTQGLVEAILTYDTKNDWVFFFSALRSNINEDIKKKIERSRHKIVFIPIPQSILSFIWNTLHIIPIEMFTGTLDWFITSDWTESPAWCKKATIIHDLAFLHFPQTIHPVILSTQKKRLSWVSKESSYIFTDSDATKKDVKNEFSISENRCRTIYPGVSIIHPKQEDVIKCKNKYQLHKPYILSVGKQEPRKNIERLICAFTSLERLDTQLVIVGQKGWGTIQNQVNSNIVFTGYVSDEELHALYSSCLFFAYPSLWEGFGYPVVEAMLHKKAVLTSETSSLQELAGGTGILCNPESIESISSGILTLLNNQKIRQKCEEEGYQKSQQYTWRTYYDEMMSQLI